MDTLSHGLYGGIAFGRKTKVSYWKSFFFGVAPDLFSFGIFTVATVLGLVAGPDWGAGTPDPSAIPTYVHHLYNVTHSFITAAVVIGLVWFIIKRMPVEMFAWPLHIIVDIPTHSSAFFPTPFLWPFLDYRFDGISWSNPYIFIPNVALLVVLYTWFYFSRKKPVETL